MTAERFEDLAMAYGGDIRRWPAEYQTEAFARLAANETARLPLLEAGALDTALNASAPMAASGVLRERLIASAPRPRPVWSRAGAWMSGAGLAAACAAGVFVGGINSSRLFTAPVTTASRTVTAPAVAARVAPVSAAPVSAATASTSDTANDAASVYFNESWFSGLESEG